MESSTGFYTIGEPAMLVAVSTGVTALAAGVPDTTYTITRSIRTPTINFAKIAEFLLWPLVARRNCRATEIAVSTAATQSARTLGASITGARSAGIFRPIVG